MLRLILEFLLLSAVIVFAGSWLTRCADSIASLTGIGRTLAGIVLLAVATSLPELAVNCYAAMIPAPDMAVGALIGSSLFNLLILAMLDLLHRTRGRMLSSASAAHALSATTSVLLTGLALFFMLLPWNIHFAQVGVGPLAIGLVYLLGLRLIYFDQQFVIAKGLPQPKLANDGHRLRTAVLGYVLATAVIFLAARVLAHTADELAVRSGLGGTFVGTTFLAITTSLPEVVTTLAAVRLGAFDMAVGNIFGSNSFNIATLFPVDLCYRKGSLLNDVAPTHTITAAAVIIVTGVATVGLLYRAEKKRWFVEPDAALVATLVTGALVLVYFLK